MTGFHNFDNNISTVFGTYKDDYTTSDAVNPTIFWENDGSVNSRLRFLNRITGNATNELGTILESGNWGIGNTNPNSKLEVRGGLFVTDLSSTSITAPTGFIYSNGPILMGSESFISSVPNNVFIATQPGTRAAIGLADPYGFLHVHSPTSGSFSGLDDFKLTDQATGNTGTDGFSLNINGSNVDIVNYENGNLRFSTNGTNVRMTIDQTGNIIIGGSTAYQVLTVNGHAAKNSGGTS